MKSDIQIFVRRHIRRGLHTMSVSDISNTHNLIVQSLVSIDRCRLSSVEAKRSVSSDNLAAAAGSATSTPTDPRRLPVSPFRDMENDEDARFVANVEEMRVSPVISRRGYLHFLEENSTGWTKLWVVSIVSDTRSPWAHCVMGLTSHCVVAIVFLLKSLHAVLSIIFFFIINTLGQARLAN